MQPLFQNAMTVDEAALLEWSRREFACFHRWHTVLTVVMLALCAGVLGGFAYMGVTTGLPFFWVCAGVVALLCALLVVNYAFRHRMYVWALLRSDKGENYPSTIATLFGEEEMTVLRLRDGAAGYMQNAEDLQNELAELARASEGLDAMDTAALAELRSQLEALKQRADALGDVAGDIMFERRLPYSALSNCLVTQNLIILYFGATAVMVRRDGFIRGSEADFTAFLRGKLAANLAAADNHRTQKNLAAGLRQLNIVSQQGEQA